MGKDFEALASLLASYAERFSDGTVPLETIVDDMIRFCASQNPLFDERRFRQACQPTPVHSLWEWEILGNYGSAWELLTTETSEADALEQLRTYRDAEPEIPHRIRRVRADVSNR